MWRPLQRGFKAVKSTLTRQWFRRSRVVAIDVENDVGSVATSLDHCNRCECPCSCTCYCHTTAENIPPPSQTPAQGSSRHSVCSDHSAQERAKQELAEADNRNSDSTHPCSPTPTTLFIPPIPASDYGTVQTSQQAGGILFDSPRPRSYLSYATVAIQQPVAQDRAGQESPICLSSGSSSTRLSPRPYNGWGVVPLPVLASPPPPVDRTTVNDAASAGAQSRRTTNDNLVGTDTIKRSSVATATTAAASLIEATEDLLNFPEVREGSPNMLFRPPPPPFGLLQQDISSTPTSHAVNHNHASSDRAPLPNVPLPTGYSARLGVYTNPNRADLDPLEFSGETQSGTQSQSYYTGIDNALANGQAASSTGIHAASYSVRPDTPGQPTSEASHLLGHTLLGAMEEAGGHSISRGQSTGQFPLSYASTIRHNMVFEVRRLGLHLDSVIGHYIHRVVAGRTHSWSVGRRSQRQAFIGLLYLQRLIEEMGEYVLKVSGAEVFAILELVSTFEGDLDGLAASLDRPSSGRDDSLFFTLLCIVLPEGLNRLYNDYEERFRRIRTFYRS